MTSPLFGLGSAAARTRARERARYERALRKASAQLARARRREAQGAGQRIASIDIVLGLRRVARARSSGSPERPVPSRSSSRISRASTSRFTS